MNKIFNILIMLITIALAAFLLILIASAIVELGRTGFAKPTNVSEIAFAIKLSLFTATLAAVMALAVSIPVAYFLSRYNFFGKSVLDTLLDLPIVLSPIALGALLLIFFNTPLGKAIENQFGPFVFEVKGIILAQFCVIVDLSIRLLKTTFEGIDVEYENLARTLGYNRLQVFGRVVLPLARKGVLASFLLVWGRAVGEFGATVTLAGATTFKTETIPVAIALSFESADITNALVFILILIGVSMAVLFAVRKTGGFRYE